MYWVINPIPLMTMEKLTFFATGAETGNRVLFVEPRKGLHNLANIHQAKFILKDRDPKPLA